MAALKEMHRVLRVHGRAILLFPTHAAANGDAMRYKVETTASSSSSSTSLSSLLSSSSSSSSPSSSSVGVDDTLTLELRGDNNAPLTAAQRKNAYGSARVYRTFGRGDLHTVVKVSNTMNYLDYTFIARLVGVTCTQS
jgi:hypothetical protein